jgi:hypothetical protein
MASTTPNLALPYPQASDSANPPQDFLNLANRLEQVVTAYLVSNSLPLSPFAGLLWYNPNTKLTYLYSDASTSYVVGDQSINPYIGVYRSSNQTISGTSGTTTIVFDSTFSSALGGSYAPTLNSSTGVVTINKTGLYQINATIEAPTNLTRFDSQITVNSVAYNGGTSWVNDPQPPRVNASIALPITSGQTVSLQALWTSGSATNLHGNNASPYQTHMTISYISATS